MLSGDELNEIKGKLIEQVNSLPEDKRQAALSQINAIPEDKFEEFLIQNNLIQGGEQKCIFCSIIDEKIETFKFAESEHAIATLDINPISKGHSMIIPKLHLKEAPKEAFQLAEAVKKRLEKTFSPKNVEIATATIFDHEIITLLPVYENETLKSEKKKMNKEELQLIQKELVDFQEERPKEETIKTPVEEKIISDETHWLPKRIP